MSPILSMLLFVVVIFLPPISSQETSSESPQQQICSTNADCSPSQCCLLGPIRQAIPYCMSFQQKNETCRVNADTMTTSLTYPDNSQLEVKNISYILCPCAAGLSCNSQTSTCQ